MKTRLFDTSSLTDFTPRNICFAEQDADAAPGAGEAEPEIILEEDAPAGEDQAEDDVDELEIGPTKHRVPRPVKEAWNGLQKTVQTEKEAIAAEKKAVEAERVRYQENMRIGAAYMKEIGKIQAIDEQLAEYEKLKPEDWVAWAGQDQAAASKAQTAVAAMRMERDKLMRSVNEKEGEIKSRHDREQAEAAAKAEQEIAAKVKDWSPAKREQFVKLGTEFMPDAQQVDMLMKRFPGVAAALNEIAQFRAAKARAAEAAAKAKAEREAAAGEPEPITPARRTGGNTTSLADNVGTENWAKRFATQRAIHLKGRLR